MPNPHSNGFRKVVIPSDLTLTPTIQDQIENILKTRNVPDKELFGIRLALEEALVNAIKHGNQLNPDKQVQISYHVNSEEFFIHIQDEGPGFDPEEVPDPMEPENLERACGRGLLLMRHYMNEVTFHPPGNAVSMRKTLKQCAKEMAQ